MVASALPEGQMQLERLNYIPEVSHTDYSIPFAQELSPEKGNRRLSVKAVRFPSQACAVR